MTHRIALALLLLPLLARPAAAEPANPKLSPPDISKLAPKALPDTPQLTIIPVPIPFLMVGALATYLNVPLGPTRNDFRFLGGYFWSHDYAYDPSLAVATPPLGMDPVYAEDNRWRFRGEWDIHLGGGWTLGPEGQFIAGGLADTGAYDQALAGGYSLSGGPLLHYEQLDERAFPLDGGVAALSYAYGQHTGTESFAFHKVGVDGIKYIHVGTDRTIAVRATLQAGFPKLAWVDKFSAGGGDFVRGYQWNRFTGDRLFAAGCEFRHLFVHGLLERCGWAHPPIDVGLAWTAQFDVGRAWESSEGLPLGSDLRAGGGLGLALTLDRAPIGRIEVNGSSEGIFPITEIGTSF